MSTNKENFDVLIKTELLNKLHQSRIDIANSKNTAHYKLSFQFFNEIINNILKQYPDCSRGKMKNICKQAGVCLTNLKVCGDEKKLRVFLRTHKDFIAKKDRVKEYKAAKYFLVNIRK